MLYQWNCIAFFESSFDVSLVATQHILKHIFVVLRIQELKLELLYAFMQYNTYFWSWKILFTQLPQLRNMVLYLFQ